MQNPDSVSAVQVSIAEQIARIRISRPHCRNALNDAGWLALAAICSEVSGNTSIRVVTIEGDGDHFCAGADIHEMGANLSDEIWMRSNQQHIASALDAFATISQPTVAIIRGCCFGGGAAVASAADFRLADINARFAVTPAKLGLTYRLIDCLRLTDLIGPARTRQLLLLARELDSSTALAWGFVDEIFHSENQRAFIEEFLGQIMKLSGYSQRGIKATLRKIQSGATVDDDETQKIFREAFLGLDFQLATQSFVEKSRK